MADANTEFNQYLRNLLGRMPEMCSNPQRLENCVAAVKMILFLTTGEPSQDINDLLLKLQGVYNYKRAEFMVEQGIDL